MEGDVVSAATLVASVLEHQGYMMQARLLETFRDFFRDAGALVYLLAGIGAVVSFALMGSFRAVRYLVIGPALFWFLVGPTTKTQGVIWQLGGGTPHGKHRELGEGAATQYRTKILEKLNAQGQGVNQPINVAIGFWLFAKPMNDFVQEFVDQILTDEDRSDLMVLQKASAMEMLAETMPTDSDFIQRLEGGLYVYCPRMMDAANAAAWSYIKYRSISKGGQVATPELDKIRQTQIERMTYFGNEAEHVPLRESGFHELIEAHVSKNGPSQTVKNLVSSGAIKTYSDGGTQKVYSGQKIRCADAWALVAEELWSYAGLAVPAILNKAMSIAPEGSAAEYACEELTRKAVFENANGDCNLLPGIALALLNRHMNRLDTFGRVVERHMNDRVHKNPSRQVVLTGSPPANGYEAVVQAGAYVGQTIVNGLGQIANLLMLQSSDTSSTQGPAFLRKNVLMQPAINLHALSSAEDAMWVSRREYEIHATRQRMFSYAMNFPYYQGIMLYLIAIAYPFLSLLVLLPGKAPLIVNVPLAWLWVKSWDIGFAICIILDKIMYNMLPSQNMPASIHTGPWRELEKLPVVLSEGINYDPLGSLHIYYTIISMALFGIPVLTGALTIKAKQAILGDFVSGSPGSLLDSAKQSGSIAGAAYGQQASAARMRMHEEIRGFARRSIALGDGLEGGIKDDIARSYASLTAALGGLDKAQVGKFISGDFKALTKAGGVAKQALGTYNSILAAEAKLESAHMAAFDKNLGRWGVFTQELYAYTSAMDDSGGYEISDKDATSFSEMYNASKAKLSAMLDAVSSAEETLAKNLVDSLGSNALLGPAELMLTPALLREGSDFASGGDILGWLHQNIPGARNYSKEEYATRLLSMHRDDFVDRSTGQPMELNPRIYGDSAQDYLQWLYQAMPRDATPGGPSTHLDTIRSTVGGNRYATEGAALEHDSETSWGSGFARSVENFYNTVYGQDAALGHQGTDAMRLQADETLQRENPQLYGKMVHDKLEYIKTYFGHDVVQRYLETHGSGFDGEIDMEDLARYTEHLARQRQGSGNVQAPSGWGGFDSSTTERGRGHSLFLGEKIESWIRQKEGTPNQGATTFQPFQGQLLLYPSDIGGGGKK